MNALLVLVLLAATPDAGAPAEPAPPSEAAAAPAPAEAPAAPELELVLPERMLEEFLVAAAPFDRVIHHEASVLGMSRRVRLDLRLMRPRVKVTPAGIRVTFDYDLRGPAGLSARGQVTPRLQLRALPEKGVLEGRLTDARLSASAVEIPVEDLMDPVLLPVLAHGPLDVGPSRVQAEVAAREVVLEEGRVRVLGRWSFSRAPPPGAADSGTP